MTMSTKVKMFNRFYNSMYMGMVQDNRHDALLQIGEACLKEDAPDYIKTFTKAFVKERQDLLTSDRELQSYALLLISLGYVQFPYSTCKFNWNNPTQEKPVSDIKEVDIEYANAEKEAIDTARATMNMVNRYGFNMKAYANVVLNAHRTLQQSWMRLACYVIEQIAKQEHYDGRNENAVLLARKMVEVDGFGGLPLI